MNLISINQIICLVFQLLNVVENLMEQHLIQDYFQRTPAGKIVTFSCDSKSRIADLTVFLMSNNYFTTIVDIEDNDMIKRNLSEMLYTHHDHFGVVLDGDCERSSFILNQCDDLEKFAIQYHWLIFSTNNDTILKILSTVDLNVNAQLTVALPMANETYWKLLDVYNPGYKHGGTLKVTAMGTWDLQNRFNINQEMFVLKYWRRKDMSEVTFKGTIVLIHEFPGELLDYLYNNDGNRSIDNFNRFQFILWTHVQDFYNYKMITNLRHVWGKQLPNGSHIGMIGALQRKEIDIALSPTYVKEERIPVVDYISQTFIEKTTFIFRNPKPEFSIRGSFFSPLSNIVWICTWIVMIITMFIIRVSFKQEWIVERKENQEIHTEYDWSYILLLIFGGICQQDVPRVPNLFSGRTLVFTSVLFTYMLYQFYSGGIVSSLLMEPPVRIHNLKDLLESTLRVGIEDVIYEKDFFDQTTDQVALELHRKKVVGKKNGSDAFYDPETGVQMVNAGGFAFQMDTNLGYQIIANTFSNEVICELNEVQLFATQAMVVMCQQDSPFRDLFAYVYRRMTEAALVQRQRIRWTTPKPQCIKIVDSSKINVGINEFFPAILFYLVGLLISIFILILEILFYKKIDSKFMFFKR